MCDSNFPEDVTGVLLDISQGFAKVWHEGLIFNLETCMVLKENRLGLENYFLPHIYVYIYIYIYIYMYVYIYIFIYLYNQLASGYIFNL